MTETLEQKADIDTVDASVSEVTFYTADQYKGLSYLFKQALKENLVPDSGKPGREKRFPHLRNPDNRSRSYKGMQDHAFRFNIIARWPVKLGNGNDFRIGNDELALFLHMDLKDSDDYMQGLVESDECKAFRPVYGSHLALSAYIPIFATRVFENSKQWKGMLCDADYNGFVASVQEAANSSLAEYKAKLLLWE